MLVDGGRDAGREVRCRLEGYGRRPRRGWQVNGGRAARMLGAMCVEDVGQLLTLLLQFSDLSPQLRVATVQRLTFLKSAHRFHSSHTYNDASVFMPLRSRFVSNM